MFGLVLGLVTQVLVSNTGYDNVEGVVNFNIVLAKRTKRLPSISNDAVFFLK